MPACGGAGYKGRVGIHELMTNSEELTEAINREAEVAESRSSRNQPLNHFQQNPVHPVSRLHTRFVHVFERMDRMHGLRIHFQWSIAVTDQNGIQMHPVNPVHPVFHLSRFHAHLPSPTRRSGNLAVKSISTKLSTSPVRD
jgi:hypothetical protein